MKRFLVGLAGFLSLLYILNPTMGIFELLPDNLPFIGNLDEATATMMLFAALRYFGWDVTDLFSKRKTIDFDKER
jgi:hypothetical protein